VTLFATGQRIELLARHARQGHFERACQAHDFTQAAFLFHASGNQQAKIVPPLRAQGFKNRVPANNPFFHIRSRLSGFQYYRRTATRGPNLKTGRRLGLR
jgi:hypothetical protein